MRVSGAARRDTAHALCRARTAPVLLVGDDHGAVISLKLSPNLRTITEVPEGKDRAAVEVEKMDTLLASIDTRFD